MSHCDKTTTIKLLDKTIAAAKEVGRSAAIAPMFESGKEGPASPPTIQHLETLREVLLLVLDLSDEDVPF